MARRRVLIDTDVLIYATQPDPPIEAVGLCGRARQMLGDLKEEKAELLVSVISVAEYLGGVPPRLRAAYEEALLGDFSVVPFDLNAVRQAARVQFERLPAGGRPVDIPRTVLKADIQILGCVLAQVPDQFVTADAAFLSLARPYFDRAADLPPLRPEQLDLGGLSS